MNPSLRLSETDIPISERGYITLCRLLHDDPLETYRAVVRARDEFTQQLKLYAKSGSAHPTFRRLITANMGRELENLTAMQTRCDTVVDVAGKLENETRGADARAYGRIRSEFVAIAKQFEGDFSMFEQVTADLRREPDTQRRLV